MALNNPAQIHEEMVFKLNNQRSPSDVQLKSLEWAIVTQLNGEKTVAQIGEILSLSPEENRVMFARLMREGLLELVQAPEEDIHAPAEILEELEYQFTYYLGPVASIILDDILTGLKRTRENLEKKQLPLLIEFLSLEISDEDKKHGFQKQMLKKIKGFV
jgi:tagatose-1,6-bisphosphate aldolase